VAYSDGPASAGKVRDTSRCVCGGSGIDVDVLRQQETEALYARIGKLESRYEQVIKSLSKRPQGKMSRQ
jgi:hypothetical protein